MQIIGVTQCTGYMGNTFCYLCLGSLTPVCARMDLLRRRIAGPLDLCKEPGRISAYPKPNRQRWVGLYITRTPAGVKLEEHLLAITTKFRLVATLNSFTLSHHNGALP